MIKRLLDIGVSAVALLLAAPLLLVVAPPPWHAPELLMLMLGAFLALGFSGGGSTAESEGWLKIATRRAGCSADSSC